MTHPLNAALRKELIAEATYVYEHEARDLLGKAQDADYLEFEDVSAACPFEVDIMPMFAAFILLAEGEEI
jgi:hypothetical protein